MTEPLKKTLTYTHSDGTKEEVEVKVEHSQSEGGGITIFIPSLNRERQTVRERLDWTTSKKENAPTASTNSPLIKLVRDPHTGIISIVEGEIGSYMSIELGKATQLDESPTVQNQNTFINTTQDSTNSVEKQEHETMGYCTPRSRKSSVNYFRCTNLNSVCIQTPHNQHCTPSGALNSVRTRSNGSSSTVRVEFMAPDNSKQTPV
jgi:hypothetical protein